MSSHRSVLLEEAVNLLNLKFNSIVVDATFGGGGHTRLIREHIGKQGIIIGIDADIKAIENFAEFPISNFQFPNNFQIPIYKKENIFLVNSNFNNLEKILEAIGVKRVDAILADLGWSSDQLTGKGMSFQKNEELDMRLSRDQELTAKKVVNEYELEELERIIRQYGEEKFSKNIVKRINEYRTKKEIVTTQELAGIITEAIPEKFRFGKNPATKTFQAIRIEVNQELKNLKKFIEQAVRVLKPRGRLAIISFHSLEDRIVKDIFRENARGCICPPDFPQCNCGNKPKILVITKKPITPEAEEIEKNLRSRSAKLRVCEKLN